MEIPQPFFDSAFIMTGCHIFNFLRQVRQTVSHHDGMSSISKHFHIIPAITECVYVFPADSKILGKNVHPCGLGKSIWHKFNGCISMVDRAVPGRKGLNYTLNIATWNLFCADFIVAQMLFIPCDWLESAALHLNYDIPVAIDSLYLFIQVKICVFISGQSGYQPMLPKDIYGLFCQV